MDAVAEYTSWPPYFGVDRFTAFACALQTLAVARRVTTVVGHDQRVDRVTVEAALVVDVADPGADRREVRCLRRADEARVGTDGAERHRRLLDRLGLRTAAAGRGRRRARAA